MNLFGVQELPASKSISHPGWAYVPDTGVNPSITALQPSSRKRAARNLTSVSGPDTSAKQNAKTLRDLAALEKESYKDIHIAVPVRLRDNAGRVSHGKVTPGVRKILQSQKTFANHLSDAEALAALTQTPSQPQPPPQPPPVFALSAVSSGRASPAVAAPNTDIKGKVKGKRGPKKKDAAAVPAALSASSPVKAEQDVVMTDAAPDAITLITPSQAPTAHLGDNDPLLRSHIPVVPLSAELEALLAVPALGYLEARAEFGEEDGGKPVRRFCEVCGYWGRVRCKACGARVCALACLRTHQEDCFVRYGA